MLWARDDQRSDLQIYDECKDKKALEYLTDIQKEVFAGCGIYNDSKI